MNRLLTLIFCFGLFCQFNAHAQGGKRFERLQSAKIGFLTERLGLTPTEAEKFWPVYNKFEAEKKINRKKMMLEAMSARLNFETMSDKELEALIEDAFKFRQADIDADRKAYTEYKKILTMKKVVMLMKAEKDFQREILRSLKGRGPEGPGRDDD